ncbi:MAG: hypothetical protein C4305_09935, partial [Thermoleophilia bacterium]
MITPSWPRRFPALSALPRPEVRAPTSALAEQRHVLQRWPSFRLLFLATLASGIGTWLAVIALTVDVFDRTGSASWVSALLIADFLPAVAIGLLLGPLVDRLSRRGLMIGADLARAIVFVALPFADSARHIVVLAALAGVATGLFRPASYAGLPNTVSDRDLAQANSLLRAAEYLTIMAGTLAGGVVAEAFGPDPAYFANAATFLCSAALLARIPSRQLQAGRSSSQGHWRDVGEGLLVVARSRALLTVFVVWNIVLLAAGATNVAEVALAKVSFSAGDLGFGLLWTATGVGQATGSLLAASWLERRGLRAVYAGAVALMAGGVSPNVWVALVCVAVGGAGNGAAVVYNSLLVQRGAPDHLRGRAFTVLMSATFAAMGVGMVAGGPLTDAVGARWVYAGAGAMTVAAA